MLRPVGKVGGGVHGTKPDDQHKEGEGVEDHPDDGHGQHLFVVLLSWAKRAFCQDGHIGETVKDGTSDPALYIFEPVEVASHYEGEENPDSHVDGRVLFEESADDGDAPNLEDEAGQEGRGEVGQQLQILENALPLHQWVVKCIFVSKDICW